MAPIFSKTGIQGRSIAPEQMNFVLKNGRIQSTALDMQSTALDLVRADRVKFCRPSSFQARISLPERRTHIHRG
jgi:hypothetical protein